MKPRDQFDAIFDACYIGFIVKFKDTIEEARDFAEKRRNILSMIYKITLIDPFVVIEAPGLDLVVKLEAARQIVSTKQSTIRYLKNRTGIEDLTDSDVEMFEDDLNGDNLEEQMGGDDLGACRAVEHQDNNNAQSEAAEDGGYLSPNIHFICDVSLSFLFHSL